MELENGLHPGIPDEEYRGWDALNQSTIKTASTHSLMHAHYEHTHPSPSTDAQIEGQGFHLLLLEPTLYDERFAAMPVNAKGHKIRRDTKIGEVAWKEFEEQHPLAWPVKQDVINEHKLMREAVMANPTARDLIEQAAAVELSAVWDHPVHGFKCKGKFDLYTKYENYGAIADVKTTIDASERAWERAVGNYGYFIQAPWYLDGLNEIAEAERRFLFIAVEKSPPYATQVHELNSLAMFEGRHRIAGVCRQWAKALEEGCFPGYQGGVNLHGIPSWEYTHERSEDLES